MLPPPDLTPIDLTPDFIAGLVGGAGSAASAFALWLHVWQSRRRRAGSNHEQPQPGDEQQRP